MGFVKLQRFVLDEDAVLTALGRSGNLSVGNTIVKNDKLVISGSGSDAECPI